MTDDYVLAVKYAIVGVQGKELTKIIQRTGVAGIRNFTPEGQGFRFIGDLLNTVVKTELKKDEKGRISLTHRASDVFVREGEGFDENKAFEEGIPVESVTYPLSDWLLNGGGREYTTQLHDMTITTAIGKAANDPKFNN